MEQAREARDRERAGVWAEAAPAREEGPVVRAEAPAGEEEPVVRAEAAVGVEEAALRQARAVTAYVPSVVKEPPISLDPRAMSSSVPSAERP
ncbi:MAG: hypothetical protein JXL84_24115 [Deltaproteobacteria bacterium]|nr:hypothetical protein [Deltaproteobacteria bacterium]